MYESKFIKAISSQNILCEPIDNYEPEFNLINNILLLPSSSTYNSDVIRGIIDQAAFYLNLTNQELIKTLSAQYQLPEQTVIEIELLRISIIAGAKFQGCYRNIRSLYAAQHSSTSEVFLTDKYNKLVHVIDNQHTFFDSYIKLFPINAANSSYQNLVEAEEAETLPEYESESSYDYTKSQIDELPERIKQYLDSLEIIDYDKINEVTKTSHPASYKIYSTKFDEAIVASKLLTEAEKVTYSNLFKQKIANFLRKKQANIDLLIRKLKSMSHYEYRSGYNFGTLDNKRLASLIANPNNNAFKQKNISEKISAAITILVDNSGSMRGKPIATAASICYLLSKIFLEYKVKFEVIGFTTCNWRGGLIFKEWQADGFPMSPGRINETRHIIYKAFNEDNIAHSKLITNFSVMLKESILKENIDGEALEFAYKRIIKQSETNKILMVISDGAPLDDATCSANGGNYLEQHLKEVIAKIEQTHEIKLLAFGINHDVNKYYRSSVRINDVDQLTEILVKKIVESI